MLIVKLELWPGGDRKRAKDLGLVRIERVDDSQMPDFGSYLVIGEPKDEAGTSSVTAEVPEFPRKLGAWELVKRAVESMNRKRIPRGPH